MADTRKRLLHIKSNVASSDGGNIPKLPQAEQLSYGEIAVNYGKGIEALSIKNSSNEIVTFHDEVHVGNEAPTNGLTEIFIDESVDPITVDVYSKQQIDSKVDGLNDTDKELRESITDKVLRGNNVSTANESSLLIDESADVNIEVYTKAEVDSLFQKLKALNPTLVWE